MDMEGYNCTHKSATYSVKLIMHAHAYPVDSTTTPFLIRPTPMRPPCCSALKGYPVKLCPQVPRLTLLSRPCCSAVKRSALLPNIPSRRPTPASCQTASLTYDRTLLLVPLQAQGEEARRRTAPACRVSRWPVRIASTLLHHRQTAARRCCSGALVLVLLVSLQAEGEEARGRAASTCGVRRA